jgi:hypothetical protein
MGVRWSRNPKITGIHTSSNSLTNEPLEDMPSLEGNRYGKYLFSFLKSGPLHFLKEIHQARDVISTKKGIPDTRL